MTYRELYESTVKKKNSKLKLISKISFLLSMIGFFITYYGGCVQVMANYHSKNGYVDLGWQFQISGYFSIISLIILILSITFIHSNFKCPKCDKNISKTIKVELRVQKKFLKTEASFIPISLNNCPYCDIDFNTDVIDENYKKE